MPLRVPGTPRATAVRAAALRSRCDAKTELDEGCPNALDVGALDLEHVAFESAAGAAGRLQPAEHLGQIVAFGRQPADNRHNFAFLSFFHSQPRRLLSWRDP